MQKAKAPADYLLQPPVGIVDLEIHVPANVWTSADIARESGIPVEIIESKFGLRKKHVGFREEGVSGLVLKAARPLLARNEGLKPDAIIYFGSPYKDYGVWMASARIQHQLGVRGAHAFEVLNVSAGCPVALKVARDMLVADPHIETILLVGASRESDLVDYANSRSRFMFNFGDGAVAALVHRGHDRNLILASDFITDGQFAHYVRMPAGGSLLPASQQTVADRLHYLDVSDPAEMKKLLDPVTLPNFLGVARRALEKSGFDLEDLDFLVPLHTKRSLFQALLSGLGLTQDQAVYLEEYGHMSAIDPLVGLCLADRAGRLQGERLVLLLSAGTGYTWAATALLWGKRGEVR